MPTIMPEGEKVRRAVRWISDEKSEDASKPVRKLIQQACLKFNLSPKEEMELTHFYQQES